MLIDTHAHLDRYLYKRYGKDVKPVLKQIEKNKILTISNSMDLTSYETICKIAKNNKHVVPAFGIHPWNAHKYLSKAFLIQKMINKTDIIGEVGLDYYYIRDKSNYPAQKKIFSLLLSKAKAKILSVHTKGAETDVLNLLRTNENEKVVIHWFSGDLSILKEMVNEGYYFSIVPEVKYSSHIREIVRQIPLKQLLTETDNPGGPASYSGKWGMPNLILGVVEEIAKIRGESCRQIEKTVEENLIRLAGQLAENIFPDLL